MRLLLVALVVSVLAYAAGYSHGRRDAGPKAIAPLAVTPPPPVEIARPPPPPAVLEVEVIAANGRRAGSVTAIALGATKRVLLPLAALDDAHAALAQTADGRVPLGPVLGLLPAARLLALAGPAGSLRIAVEPASLPLGRSIIALQRARTVAGQVESAAQRREDGSYAYRVRLQQPLDFPFAALVDETGAELIGAITAAGGELGVYEAVDAGALQTLAASDTPPVELERFAREFFAEQPAGRLIAFEHAVTAGDWATAIALGADLMNLGWSYRDAVSAPLADAYMRAARAAQAQPERAIALLDDAARMLGDAVAGERAHAPYYAELGGLYHAQGRYVEAAASLENAIAQDPSLASELDELLASARQRLRTPDETLAPLHASDGGLYVYVNVGGQRLRFVLDTGATYTALSAQAAHSLGLDRFADAQRVALATAGGRVDAPLVTLRALDVNGAVVQQVPVVILDSMLPFDGLLGMSYLDHFDVEIDRGAGHIRLVRR